MSRPKKTFREENITARVADAETLSALDFINDNAPRRFNMSQVMRDALRDAAIGLGWEYTAASTDSEI